MDRMAKGKSKRRREAQSSSRLRQSSFRCPSLGHLRRDPVAMPMKQQPPLLQRRLLSSRKRSSSCTSDNKGRTGRPDAAFPGGGQRLRQPVYLAQ